MFYPKHNNDFIWNDLIRKQHLKSNPLFEFRSECTFKHILLK